MYLHLYIKSIIFNTVITTHLRFQINEILKYNFDENHNIKLNSSTLYKIIFKKDD